MNSRPQKRPNNIWRRRKCLQCGNIFSTIEAAELTGSLQIRRQDILLPFSRETLLLSIYDSCRHRRDAVEAAKSIHSTVVGKLFQSAVKNGIVDRADIVRTVASALKGFDHAAHVQYLAFHPL